MSAKPIQLTETDKLERELNRLLAAQKRQFKNENILYLEKNGDIGYERTRTIATDPSTPTRSVSEGLLFETPAISHSLPNTLPQPPMNQEIGNKFDASAVPSASDSSCESQPQPPAESPLPAAVAPASLPPNPAPISCHDTQNSAAPPAIPNNPTSEIHTNPKREIHTNPKRERGTDNQADQRDPLEELLHRAVSLSKVRRGRPPALDDVSKGQLVALLAVGMSMRQAAAVLGVSHTTVQKALKADPSLNDDITSARFQAQLQPLACVIREARRSWKAATWLLKYLDSKIATHEETPDVRRARQQRESDEFFARPTPGIQKRKA